MADYSKVNISNAREAINYIINHLNYSASENIIDSLSDTSYWQGNSKLTFTKALNKQKDTNYKKLEQKLDDYLIIINYMESWQQLNNDNKNYAQKRDEAESKIYKSVWKYKTDAYGEYILDAYGNKQKEWYKQKDKYWENEYNKYVNKIKENTRTMDSYASKISELI